MKTKTTCRILFGLMTVCLFAMLASTAAEAQMRRYRPAPRPWRVETPKAEAAQPETTPVDAQLPEAPGADAAGVAVVLPEAPQPKSPQFANDFFYTADGKFDEEKAKDAIVALCEYHGYPMFPNFRERLWVFDYGMGHFAELGLACVVFVNKVDGQFSYMLQDLFMLPGQMLPEHWHIVPESTPNCPQKDEGWFLRHGSSYIVGEGEANLPPEVVVPTIHMDGKVTVEHCTLAKPGDFVPLVKVGTRHWQFAGPEGFILTEVANAHDNASVRHSDPVANKAFLGE